MAASSSIIRTEPVVTTSTGRRLNTAASDIDCLPDHGEFEMKGRTLAGMAFHPDLPSVFLNDSIGHREPQPCAFLRRRGLGGKKRIVDPADLFSTDPRARVSHTYV